MNMNKKYIILFVGVIILFIIFIAVIFFQQNQNLPTPSSLQNQNPAALQPNQQTKQSDTTVPQVTLSPLTGTAVEATEQFYNYYFSTSVNPLANGAYKDNPYLSQDFKDILGSLYNNGNAPLFCPQNKRASIVVGKEQQNYYNNQYVTQEIISEAPPGTKDLYRVSLENQDGKWFIFDVNCIY
jgi:hypothetical protein